METMDIYIYKYRFKKKFTTRPAENYATRDNDH